MPPRIVVDTSVLTAALLRARAGDSSRVLRLCLERRCRPMLGAKLFSEYESVLTRGALFKGCPLTATQRMEFLAGLAAVSEWVTVHYLWRPNLPDEGDNHLVELAVAGGARVIVTHNVRDFRRAELKFPDIAILTPAEFLPMLTSR